jgi:hypothetical protein
MVVPAESTNSFSPALCSWRSTTLFAAPALVQLAKTRVAIAIRVGLPVLFPKQLLSQVQQKIPAASH